jgi:hypothetical protein
MSVSVIDLYSMVPRTVTFECCYRVRRNFTFVVSPRNCLLLSLSLSLSLSLAPMFLALSISRPFLVRSSSVIVVFTYLHKLVTRARLSFDDHSAIIDTCGKRGGKPCRRSRNIIMILSFLDHLRTTPTRSPAAELCVYCVPGINYSIPRANGSFRVW